MVHISGSYFHNPDDSKPKKSSNNRTSFNQFREDVFTLYNKSKLQAGVPLTNITNHPPVYYQGQTAGTQVSVNEHVTNHPPVYYQGQTAEMQVSENEHITNHPPVYYQEEPVQAQMFVNEHVTGPAEGENPAYDAIVKPDKSNDVENLQNKLQEYVNSGGDIIDFIEQNYGKDSIIDGYNEKNPKGKSLYVLNNGLAVLINRSTNPATITVTKAKQNSSTTASTSENNQQGVEVPEQHKINANGVTGSYSLTDGDDGKGFSLITDMSVSILSNKDLRNLFSPKGGMLGFEKTDDGQYTYRGLKAKNPNILNQKLQGMAQQVAIRQAVYNDLMAKQETGVELSSAEQNFANHYLKLLDRLGLQQDENGNLIEK